MKQSVSRKGELIQGFLKSVPAAETAWYTDKKYGYVKDTFYYRFNQLIQNESTRPGNVFQWPAADTLPSGCDEFGSLRETDPKEKSLAIPVAKHDRRRNVLFTMSISWCLPSLAKGITWDIKWQSNPRHSCDIHCTFIDHSQNREEVIDANLTILLRRYREICTQFMEAYSVKRSGGVYAWYQGAWRLNPLRLSLENLWLYCLYFRVSQSKIRCIFRHMEAVINSGRTHWNSWPFILPEELIPIVPQELLDALKGKALSGNTYQDIRARLGGAADRLQNATRLHIHFTRTEYRTKKRRERQRARQEKLKAERSAARAALKKKKQEVFSIAEGFCARTLVLGHVPSDYTEEEETTTRSVTKYR